MAPERSLIQDDDVVEAFSADRANEPLYIVRLPGGSEGGEHFGNFHAFDLGPEDLSVDAVAVSQQEPRLNVPRKRLHKLRSSPLCGRVLGDIEMHNPPPIMSQHKKNVQDLESNGGYHAKVNGHQLLDMILEKRPPSLRRRPPMLDHVLRDRGL